MSKREELFNEFNLLGNQVRDLRCIVQNESRKVTWEQVEEFDSNLERALRSISSMRMRTILFLKDEGLIEE